MLSLQSSGPSQHYRRIPQRSKDSSRMESCSDDKPYRQSSEDRTLKMQFDNDYDLSELNHQSIGNRYAFPPIEHSIKPDNIRKRVESWMGTHADLHGGKDDRPPANDNTRFSLQKRRRMMDAESERGSLSRNLEDEPFYPHLSSSSPIEPTETVRKNQLYRSNFNFGETTIDSIPIKAPTELRKGRINSSNCEERKPFTPVQRPKTCLSTSSSAVTTFSESESNNSNQNSLDSVQSFSFFSPTKSSAAASSISTGGEELYRQPLKCNLFGKFGSKRADHALYADQVDKDRDNRLKQDPQQSNFSISSLLCSSAPSDHNKHSRAPIQTNLHSAEGTGESEANTSGSAMAEHGHESEIGERRSDEQQREGDGSGRERRSGSGHGGGGGDDRQSSASTGLGKAGEDTDGRRYHLRIVQQPEKGCAFGSDVLSRLAIAPPLIVQIRVTDLQNNEVEIDDEIPLLTCQVNLLTEDGQNADMITSLTNVQHPVTMLYGTLTASAVQLPDVRQRLRTFFIFPEISIRSKGRFRLNINLFKLPLFGQNVRQALDVVQESAPASSTELSRDTSRSNASPTPATESQTRPSSPRRIVPGTSHTLVSIISEPIDVVPPSEYQAPHITDLTRHFAANGVGLLMPYTQAAEN
ncbi:uncharacterized protein FA14DRAFT_180079 [Meira miltonrushii]|uniref:Velvet domain-containing protein n=1 Tax=Meira miltonrushii TaxID=1280837 RepID=A0A316VB45_9BASI|nr:uncharacterized protein FA14DRAFT_180079 [Meira miltonrushii]PWN33433.1 hypothetical protein FA14DRAFT_180079 [Meira miltonrushii]